MPLLTVSVYPDESGGEPYGDTAFFFPHRHLGEAHHARPDILFAIDETETNNPQPSYDPGWMMYDPVKREISDDGTLIVLNPADNPIVNWKEIPLCISPHMSGFKIEYMRRINKAIRQRDIVRHFSEFSSFPPLSSPFLPFSFFIPLNIVQHLNLFLQ